MLYYGSAEAAGALAQQNGLDNACTLQVGAELILPSRLMVFGGIRETGELKALTEVKVLELRPEAVLVEVQENVFPGTSSDMVPLEGKWIYVVHEGKVAVTVEARSASEWVVIEDTLFGTCATINDRKIRLKRGGSYAFFCSPIELTDAARAYLAENVSDCRTVTHLEKAGEDTITFVRDAFLWALDVHHNEFLPKLTKWQEWVLDKDTAARLFIASTLKLILGTEDPLGLENQLLDGQPDQFLREYEKSELELREAAESAMAQLANLIDSFDHRAIERAAMERGGDALAAATVQWAGVLSGVLQTLPGRELAAQLVADENRLPLRYIFTTSPPDNVPPFATTRYLSLSAMAIVADLGPAVSEVLRSRRRDPLPILAGYLERLSGEKPLVGAYKQIQSNLRQGRRLNRGVVASPRTIRKLMRKAGATGPAELPSVLAKSERLAKAYERNFGGIHSSFHFTLEVINLANAIGEFNESAGGDKLLTSISVVGASADLGIVLAESMEILLKEASRGILKRGVAVLGVISGVCDFIGFAASAEKAYGKHDFNQAVGHGLAAGGAIIAAVGSAMIVSGLATSAGASSGAAAGAAAAGATGVGAIVVIIGGAVMAVGSTLAWLLTDNVYEEFAKYCFLGEENSEVPQQLDWSPIPLPTSSREKEALVLINLLSNFRITAHSNDGGHIYPGLYGEGDVFDVYIEEHYRNRWLSANAARLEIDLTSGEIRQVEGVRPLAQKSGISRDSAGRIQSIYICAEEETRPVPILQFRARRMLVRLRSANSASFVPPPRPGGGGDQWVKASLAPPWSDLESSSLDLSRRADLNEQPFMAMRAMAE